MCLNFHLVRLHLPFTYLSHHQYLRTHLTVSRLENHSYKQLFKAFFFFKCIYINWQSEKLFHLFGILIGTIRRLRSLVSSTVLLNFSTQCFIVRPLITPAQASMAKLRCSNLLIKVYRLSLSTQLVQQGRNGCGRNRRQWAPVKTLEREAQVLSCGKGVIQPQGVINHSVTFSTMSHCWK